MGSKDGAGARTALSQHSHHRWVGACVLGGERFKRCDPFHHHPVRMAAARAAPQVGEGGLAAAARLAARQLFRRCATTTSNLKLTSPSRPPYTYRHVSLTTRTLAGRSTFAADSASMALGCRVADSRGRRTHYSGGAPSLGRADVRWRFRRMHVCVSVRTSRGPQGGRRLVPAAAAGGSTLAGGCTCA